MQTTATEAPRTLLVGASPEERGAIETEIADLTRVVGVAAGDSEARRLAADPGAELVLVVLDHEPDAMMDAARQLAQVDGRAVIALSRDRDPDLIVRAMRAGARDFAYLEQPGDIWRAVAALRVQVAEQGAHRGHVIAVFGAKGGCGATTVAANLAGALCRPTGRTVLVDLDTQRGDALVFLDLNGGFGWHDLVRELPRLDDELLDRSLLRHASGLRVLAETAALEEADPPPPAELARALQRLAEHADHVVVDGLHDFGDASLAVLDMADTILLTFTQDVPAMKNASRCLALFRRLGYGPGKVKLVLNRYGRKNRLGLEAIADALGAPVDATIANDFPAVHGAIDAGQLLADAAPRAQVTRDVQTLAATLEPKVTVPRKRLFARGGK